MKSSKQILKIESFIMKTSKTELINCATEDENNGTEKVKHDEYLYDFTKLQLYMHELCISKEFVKENCPSKESSDSEEDTGRIGNTLWCSCGKCKSMQKAFAA